MLAREPVPELMAVIIPSIDVLIESFKSRLSVPIPVQTPPSHPVISLPIAPFTTLTFKSAPSVVAIRVFATP